MALYELVLQSTYSNQQFINRFNFTMSGTPSGVTGALALATAFGAIPSGGSLPSGTLLDDIRAIQVAALKYEQCIVKNVYDPLDFYDAPFVPQAPGLDTANPGASPVDAAGFLSTQVRRDIRHGTKRFSGIGISLMTAGGGWNGGMTTLLTALAAKLGAVLQYPLTGTPALTFNPCIVGKEKYAVPGSSPTRYAYRYYLTESVQMAKLAVGIAWSSYPTVRSQTSRQYGRGG